MSEVPSLTPNPFKPVKLKKSRPQSIKYCAWEVLKDKPDGLVLTDLIKDIKARGLRQFSRKRSSTQVVSSELKKQKDFFTYDKDKNSWCIDSKLIDLEKTEDDKSIFTSPRTPQHKKESTNIEQKTSELKRHKPPLKSSSSIPQSSSHKRGLNRSPSPRPRKKAKGSALVGLPVKVWWAGEQQYFSGKISSYNQEKDRYDISYEDGDLDIDLELRKYDIKMKGSKIACIKINEHNMDDDDDEEGNSGQDDDDDDGKKTEEVTVVAEVEKQLSDEGGRKLQE